MAGLVAALLMCGARPAFAAERIVSPWADEEPTLRDSALEGAPATSWWSEGWTVTFYSGWFSSQKTSEIFFHQNLQLEDSAVIALAGSKEWAQAFDGRMRFEFESGIVRHVGKQHHWEVNIPVIIARWTRFPWNDVLPTTFALGNGLSFTSSLPRHEVERNGEDTARTLNYLMGEITIRRPSNPHWHLGLRYHHRSGVRGLFSGVYDASNIFALAVKYRF
jgi:hypothetical protein